MLSQTPRKTITLGFAIILGSVMLLMTTTFLTAKGAAWTKTTPNLAAPFRTSVQVIFVIGRPRFQCTGFGICKVIVDLSFKSARGVQGNLSLTDDGKLELAFQGKLPEEGRTLFIDEDINLAPDTAKKLGVKSVVISRGEYVFNASRTLLNAKIVK